MDEVNGVDHIALHDINRQLGLTKSISDSDPLAIWEEDGDKIRLLADTVRSMKLKGQPRTEHAERALEALKWKRCDLGRQLLRSVPTGDGQTIWSEKIETSKQKAKVKTGVY